MKLKFCSLTFVVTKQKKIKSEDSVEVEKPVDEGEVKDFSHF